MFENKLKKYLIWILLMIILLKKVDVPMFENSIQNFSNHTYGITIDIYNYEPFSETEKAYISYADKLMNEKLIVHKVFDDFPDYNRKNINWDIQYGESQGTYQLYLQCLNPIAILSMAYRYNNNEEYLLLAKDILNSWLNYEKSNPENRMLWYDHGTALRVENIIYFLLTVNSIENQKIVDNNLHNEIVLSLKEHVELLMSEEFYTKNHNHGIFQDRALIYLSYFLNDDSSSEMLKLAKDRLSTQKDFAFNQDMVHVENSPGYHIGAVDMFYKISQFLNDVNDVDAKHYQSNIDDANKFNTYITKPNTGLAEIGDTNSILQGKISGTGYRFNSENLLYATTLGKKGKKPIEKSVLFPYSGYYLYREHWNKENFIESDWLMFKSGYTSKTHKHADDLSFMLYSNGYDIFVDPGWYNYVMGNKYRDYLMSSHAHNTIVVDDKTYSYTEENSYKVGLLDYKLDENGIDIVSGFNNMYKGVEIDRTIYNLKNNKYIIFDDIKSEEEHNYKQLFHVSEFLDIIDSNDNEALLKFKNNSTTVKITQLLKNTNLEIIKGDFDKQNYGYISRRINHIESIPTLSFNQTEENTQYITLIEILKNEQQCEYIFSDNRLELTLDDFTNIIHFESRQRSDINKIQINKISDNTFKFTHLGMQPSETSYAWYIIKENGEVEERITWSSENTLEYFFKDQENYLVKSYLRDDYGVRKQKMIAKFDYINGQFFDVSKNYELNFYINKLKYSNIGNKYTFTVDTNYFWDTSYKWYIYKDGVYYTTLQSNNILEYEFEEPGNYTVSFYVKTKNGDREFWNYPILSIK